MIIALPLGGQRVIEMPLVYTLLNCGEKSAKEIEVYLRMNKGLRYGGHFELVATGSEEKNARMTVANETEHLKTTVTSINSLHPNQRFVVSDNISIASSTSSNHSVSVKTGDNVDLTLRFNLQIGFAIDIFISQADQSPITKRILLSIVDTSEKSVKEYFDEYNQQLFKKQREKSAKLRFFDRLRPVRNDELKKVKLLIIDQSGYKENETLPADNLQCRFDENVRRDEDNPRLLDPSLERVVAEQLSHADCVDSRDRGSERRLSISQA